MQICTQGNASYFIVFMLLLYEIVCELILCHTCRLIHITLNVFFFQKVSPFLGVAQTLKKERVVCLTKVTPGSSQGHNMILIVQYAYP